MSSQFHQFKDLHRRGELFVLPNAWDAASALIFQEKGFPAIATSSAAIAASLGYADGEKMSFSEYLFIIRRILAAIRVPLSVDLEMGYGGSDEEIYANIRQLIDLGIVGINIEDSTIQGTTRTLKDASLFAGTISFIRNKLRSEGLDLFINIRCDTFILNVDKPLEETIRRLKIYDSTGADGIFLPCISAEDDISAVMRNTDLPLNVMAIPGLPGFETLNRLGVKRVSMGSFLFNKVYDNINDLVRKITVSKMNLPKRAEDAHAALAAAIKGKMEIKTVYCFKLLFATLLLVLFCATCYAQTSPLEEARIAIAKSNDIYFQAFAKGDSSIFIDRYAKDCWIMPPNAKALRGKDAPLEFFRTAYNQIGLRNGKFITVDVFGDGNEYVTEIGFWQSLDAGNQLFDNGKYLVLWKKTPEGWKMFRDSFSSDRRK